MRKVTLVSIGPRGAMGYYIACLANALVKHIKVKVVVADYMDEGYFDKNVEIIKIRTGTDRKRVLLTTFNFYNFYKIWKIFSRLDTDIIHFTSSHPWNFIISFFIKQPIVYTLHEPKVLFGENPLLIFSYHLMIPRAKKIIILAKTFKKYLLKKNIPKEKICQIPHGAFSLFRKWKRTDIKEEPMILFFGRIEKYKGIDYLLKALFLVKREIPEIKLTIAGPGNLTPYLKDIKRPLHLEILNSFIPDPKVAELFQRAKVIVLPYIEATQSGVPSIAYSFKKPVVATDVGGLSELIDDSKTGHLVKPKDAQALAQALIKVLKDDKKRKEMGEKGFEKMEREFSWEKIALKMVKVYEEVNSECKLNK